jgi:PPM family protein phosphatase
VLRISEQWHGSDLGRQRQGNEDSYFVRAPLFVVADGMGGAQAGEVASEMAVESFDRGLPGGPPAESLVQVIEGANRRIHDRSQADAGSAGMGTTVTAAYVGQDEVTIAHVGDSRAYVLRDHELIRLTRDHSLVDELVRRGKLTAEQAESHPQRSVITRALGPEPDVEVDVEVYQARSGDVFLLCSDGLTGMVPEARVKPIIEGAGSLSEAGRELIAAANAAGGRDNITVILFRLEEVGAPVADGRTTTEQETWEGEALGGGAATTVSAVRPKAQPIHEPPAAPAGPPRRRRRRRWVAPVVAVVVVLAIVFAGLWTATRAVYFVGVDERTSAVTIYRGLPYELPFGIELYESYFTSGVTIQAVPTDRRSTFTDHKLRPKDDAEDLVRALERGEIQ